MKVLPAYKLFCFHLHRKLILITHFYLEAEWLSVQKLWNNQELYEKLWGISHVYNPIWFPKTQPPEAVVRTRLKETDTSRKKISERPEHHSYCLKSFHVLLFVVLWLGYFPVKEWACSEALGSNWRYRQLIQATLIASVKVSFWTNLLCVGNRRFSISFFVVVWKNLGNIICKLMISYGQKMCCTILKSILWGYVGSTGFCNVEVMQTLEP